VSAADIQDLLFGTLQGVAFSTLFLLAAFIGFCTLAGLSKLRATSATSMVIKSLDERVGQERFARFLPPDAPRGPVDVLKVPGTSLERPS
jgi:hypothetical protein